MGDVLILCAGAARVRVDPARGGRLTSLELAGCELLGSGRPPSGLPAAWFFGCFPMAPYAGRLDRGRFSFAGQEHRLPLNSGIHSAHGTVCEARWVTEEVRDTRLTMSTTLGPPWPFGGRVRQQVDLQPSGLTLTLSVVNDERVMPVALGFHPWFRRDLGRGGVEVDVRPALRCRPDEEGIARELVPDLGSRPWDDAFTGLAEPPVLRWPGGPTVRLHSDAPVWVVYERSRDAVCIEPLTSPPNSLATGEAAVVGPGVPLDLTLAVSWQPGAA